MPSSNVSIITPLDSLSVTRRQIPSHGKTIPNTSIQGHPLTIYHSAFVLNDEHRLQIDPSSIERHLISTGVVLPQWRYTMYPTSHFHSTTHEVLCVFSGRARLCFGGETNTERYEPIVKAGDVIIVPAGVSHRLLEDLDGDFQMVGSYPVGSKSWDMCYGEESDISKIGGIEGIKWFHKDPVYGNNGPATE